MQEDCGRMYVAAAIAGGLVQMDALLCAGVPLKPRAVFAWMRKMDRDDLWPPVYDAIRPWVIQHHRHQPGNSSSSSSGTQASD
jgi:hypothetical protein